MSGIKINHCNKTMPCGHNCLGVENEAACPPCIMKPCSGSNRSGQTSDDFCMVCLTDNLAATPILMLRCGHVFHITCIRKMIDSRWPGNRITFGFTLCPACKRPMEHPDLTDMLGPVLALQEDVQRKALTRLEHDGLVKSIPVTGNGSPFYRDPAGYALSRYCYYQCCKCTQAYFGGLANCADGINDDNIRPEHLVCPACSSSGNQESCQTHGTDFLEYKCRYCCSVAIYFCFGTTHFCEDCHRNHCKVTGMTTFPKCPAGPIGVQLSGKCPLNIDHPPCGTEFVLGCGVCANIQTF